MIVITTKTYNCNNAFTYNKCINNTIVHLKLLIYLHLKINWLQVAVILKEELFHKNVLQDVKRLNRPSYCQPGDFSQFCQSLWDQTHQL